MGNLTNDLFSRILIALSDMHGYGAIGRVSVNTVFADQNTIGRLNKTHSERRRVGYQVGRCERTLTSVHSHRFFFMP
jgi:hypothetical protein